MKELVQVFKWEVSQLPDITEAKSIWKMVKKKILQRVDQICKTNSVNIWLSKMLKMKTKRQMKQKWKKWTKKEMRFNCNINNIWEEMNLKLLTICKQWTWNNKTNTCKQMKKTTNKKIQRLSK